MFLTILYTVAIGISGLMVGNELAVSAFVHPQLWKLDDKTHTASVQSLARIYGAFMPFWYALVLLLTVVLTYTLYPDRSTPFWLAVTSMMLWFISIVFTLIGPVRINNEVIHWDLEALPKNWQARRKRWDQLHAFRVFILTVAFICLILACLMAQTV